MNNHSQQQDRLEKAVAALREAQPATGLSEELLERTITLAGAGEEKMGSQEKGWWTMRTVKWTAWGTGLAAAAIGLCWMIFAMNGRMAFADVIERVKIAKILRCKITSETDIAGQGKLTQSGDMIMSQTWMIERISGMKMIMDSAKGQMITLTDMPKQAIVMSMNNAPAAARGLNLLDSFGKFDAHTSKPLADMQIDGKPARGFEITKDTQHMKVWADLKTELPVRIEADMAMFSEVKVVFTDFEWDPAVTPDEISLAIPKGYAVINANVDSSKPTEADITKMLSAWTKFNHGRFPEKLTFTAFIQLMATNMIERQGVETTGMTPEQKDQWLQKMTSENLDQTMPVSRGLSFISDPASGSGWQYDGNAVEPGAKDRAILWYQPANTSTWRVFNADLTVHDAKEAPAGGTPVNTKDIKQNPTGATQPAPVRSTLP
jgi:hypothetical protein